MLSFFVHFLLCFVCSIEAINLTIASTGGNNTSPLQYGLIFEDINHSGDGGIYAELIRNRAFQGSSLFPSTIDPWTSIGPAVLSLSTESPTLSSALPTYLRIKSNGTGSIGIQNPGWWGISVQPQAYTGFFWVNGNYSGNFTVNLESAVSTEEWASVDVVGVSNSGEWIQYNFTITPTVAAPYSNNTFSLIWTPESDEVVNIGFVSLFPPTYNNRPNGMRPELMTVLKNLNPSYLRCPGGNNLEGQQPPFYWKWNETIGPLIDRPGRPGDWGYQNTDGLGLVEYLQWCEDFDMEPVLAVWAGYYLDQTVVSQADLGPYVQDTMNELEYIMGSVSTTYGALRASHGYPDPWAINYVEIGNEDNVHGEGSYVSYRFQAFYGAIHAKYPDITILASSVNNVANQPKGSGGDYHIYSRPDALVLGFNTFDHFDPDHPTLVGEYAALEYNNGDPTAGVDYGEQRLIYPWWVGTIAEAVYEIGIERNADKVLGSSYAPALQNLNSYEWTPDLIAFTADPSQTVLSTSYHGIKLFSNTRMTTVLPVTADANLGPAYWVAGVNDKTSQYILKLAIYNATSSQTFNVEFGKSSSTASITILTAPDPYSSFVLNGTDPVVTTTKALTAVSGNFSFELENYSMAVLTVDL